LERSRTHSGCGTLLGDGKSPLGVGFFFSLGHATIVFSLTTGFAAATQAVDSRILSFQSYGSAIGAGVSGTFLWISAYSTCSSSWTSCASSSTSRATPKNSNRMKAV
jgi:hypothetical protein